MSFATYSDLKTSIAGYLARSDLTSQIPDFITFAENRLRRELRIRQMLKSVTTSSVSGDATVEIPSDFLEIRDFVVMTNPIQPLSYSSPSALSNDPRTSQVGVPKSYTILASEFQLTPAPHELNANLDYSQNNLHSVFAYLKLILQDLYPT